MRKRLVVPSYYTKKFQLFDFSKGVNGSATESLLSPSIAKKSFNFCLNNGGLTDGVGVEQFSIKIGENLISPTLPNGVIPLKLFFYKRYDYVNENADDRLLPAARNHPHTHLTLRCRQKPIPQKSFAWNFQQHIEFVLRHDTFAFPPQSRRKHEASPFRNCHLPFPRWEMLAFSSSNADKWNLLPRKFRGEKTPHNWRCETVFRVWKIKSVACCVGADAGSFCRARGNGLQNVSAHWSRATPKCPPVHYRKKSVPPITSSSWKSRRNTDCKVFHPIRNPCA